MRSVFVILAFGSLLSISCVAKQKTEKSSEPVETYELYSWRDDGGGWNFAVLSTTSRLRTPEEIFSEKVAIHGVDNLKGKMSHFMQRSRIVWIENLFYKGVPIKGTERLGWPPKEMIDDIKIYAAARHIEIVGPK